MKKLTKLFLLLILVLLLGIFVSCKKKDSAYALYDASPNYFMEYEESVVGKANEVKENPIIDATLENESYFTMDSSKASYSELRRAINSNTTLYSGNIIRTDEIINYFSYNIPKTDEDFYSQAEISKCPWNDESYLLTLYIRTKSVEVNRYSQGNNFVFLIDVSGSMNGETRIELVKKSMLMLIDALNDNDTISIVTYASGVNTLISGEKASNKSKLKETINNLKASGSTSGSKAIERAYNELYKYYIEGGNNRIIICSDGDFNVGVSSTEGIKSLIDQYRRNNTYITTLGFGMNNYRDDMMETIARSGNGVFAYIDNINEAKKVLIDEMDNSLCVVSKDTKSKVVFNSDVVSEYRLIGYESKTITKEDYENEHKDAGELGSNNTTVVCYVIKLKSEQFNKLVKLEIKYKDPLNDENKVYSNDFSGLAIKDFNNTTEDYKFVSGLIEFVLAFRGSGYKGTSDTMKVAERLSNLESVQNDPIRHEFLELVEKYNKQTIKEK